MRTRIKKQGAVLACSATSAKVRKNRSYCPQTLILWAIVVGGLSNENDLVACCDESVFKTLDVDARREIYERLNDKTNVWAKAFRKLI